MSNKILVMVALTVLSATAVLGATFLIVNGAGIISDASALGSPGPAEVRLLIGNSGNPNSLVITQGNQPLLNIAVSPDSISFTDTQVEFLGADSISGASYFVIASSIDSNTWELDTCQSNSFCVGTRSLVNGHLQINIPQRHR